ncbi:hypothetical protein [Actinoplanes subtropicus]|nr:hypothetical protein [Actinoplanes subtropicus]
MLNLTRSRSRTVQNQELAPAADAPDSLDTTDSNFTERWARCGGIDPV